MTSLSFLSFFLTLSTAAASGFGCLSCFCPLGTELVTVSFDTFSNSTLVQGGDSVSDWGYGFGITTYADDGDDPVEELPVADVPVASSDPGRASLGHILKMMRVDGGDDPSGVFYFHFPSKAHVASIQLVDMQTTPRISYHVQGMRSLQWPESFTGSVYDAIIARRNVDHLKIRIEQGGAIGNIKLCVPI